MILIAGVFCTVGIQVLCLLIMLITVIIRKAKHLPTPTASSTEFPLPHIESWHDKPPVIPNGEAFVPPASSPKESAIDNAIAFHIVDSIWNG